MILPVNRRRNVDAGGLVNRSNMGRSAATPTTNADAQNARRQCDCICTHIELVNVADSRIYIKVGIDYFDHPKIVKLSDSAVVAHLQLIAYSRRLMTNGEIPKEILQKFAKKSVINELLSNKISEESSPSLIEKDGKFWLHDFLEHQSSRSEIQANIDRNRINGALGGMAKAKRVAGESLASRYVAQPSESVAKREREKRERTTSNEVVNILDGSNDSLDLGHLIPAPNLEELFDQAYTHWPKRVERKAALERFKLAAKKRDPSVLVAEIIRFGDAYAETTPKQFTPALGVWIGHERWNDDLPTDSQPQTRNPTRTDANLAFVRERELARQNQVNQQRGIGA